MAARPLSVSFPCDDTHFFSADAVVASPISRSDASFDSPQSPSVLSAPFTRFPSQHTSPMAARSYRPQEWANRGPGRASHMSFASSSDSRRHSVHTSHATGMEASLPSPPPPYVPPSPRSSAQLRLASDGQARHDATAFYRQPGNGYSSTHLPPQLALEVGQPPSQRLNAHRNSTQYLAPIDSGVADSHFAGPAQMSQELPPAPPASRRCHSTGELASRYPPGGTNPILTPPQIQGPWQPGIPLPPPPPGPPPPNTRSMSLGRGFDRSSSTTIAEPSTPRRRFGLAEPTPLSPVPPTPADYIGDIDNRTSVASSSSSISPTTTSSASQNSCLTRRPAQKDGRPEAIRDRRSRSRAMRSSLVLERGSEDPFGHDGPSTRPANLVLKALQKSPVVGRASPRLEQQQQQKLVVSSSRDPHKLRPGVAGEPTPPYSPENAACSTRISIGSVLTPASILSPPASSQSSTSSRQTPTTVFTPSHAHCPDQSAFMDDSLARLLKFHEQELEATTNQERLRLFADFIVKESVYRKVQYSSDFNDIAPELYNVTENMWHSDVAPQAVSPRGHSIESVSVESRTRSIDAAFDSTTPSDAPMTPATDQGSFTSLEHDQDILNQSPWNDRYKPSLSPIPSMTVSTVADESDSRGRTPSRWWEPSDGGSPREPQRFGLERSRQETKYMSLHPGILQSPKSPPGTTESDRTGGTAQSEYPPEKVGWHEQTSTPQISPSLQRQGFKDKQVHSQPDMSPLDVSRLVTLPPAYPRHYPAVNNCHPQLDPPRLKHREIADIEEIEKIRARFENEEGDIDQDLEHARKKRISSFRTGVQEDINSGVIDKETALEADRRFRAHEIELQARAAREAFDRFHLELFDPVNTQLQKKIDDADICINMMTLALTRTASGEHSANAIVQVGGDEEPELLEQLTLVRWLFEAREKLHEEMFDTIVLERHKHRLQEKFEPTYRTLPQPARDEGNARFAAAIRKMHLAHASAAHARHQDLASLMQAHVTAGVEAQISAFWDIAPQILEVVQRVPIPPPPSSTVHENSRVEAADRRLACLPIVIPPAEVEESPALATWPAQYLFTTLTHAQNSVRQFIDAQVNLLCLMHGVACRALEAEGRVGEMQGRQSEGHMEGARKRLDRELQVKCAEIEEGWNAALGDAMEEARGAVRGFLERSGGWEEGLEG
ncbi:hypothetical protein K461DRAFT_292548 [Myriangium duriaei CBS 260.36]|uniref:Uncharacterized protein n=1 Tax=Myriangium duriaei CBS 260.36 TaxID=1168546 RepID=A0A9P4MI58_9PEZI|nr:hypothetical protein K461DRAFT_292548 [Myriangium duriaei CBS 260.36]